MAATTLAAGLLVGCGKQDAATPAASAAASAQPSPSAQATDGKRLVLALMGEPEQGFDPIKGWGRYGNPLFQSTLLKRTDKLEMEGDLATEWVFPPFRAVLKSRSYAAMANFWIGVIPPSAMLGRS